MTDQATPFTEDTPAAPAPAAAPVADPAQAEPTPAFQVPDSVKELVGEGKKYNDVNAALNALPHAQSHIAQIEAENARLREQAEAARNAEDVLAEIKAAAQPQDAPAEQPAPQVSTEVVAQLVDQRLQASKAAEIADANTKQVIDTMTTKYGDAKKAEEVYLAKATELEISVAEMNSLIAKSPKAALTMFGLSSPETPVPEKISSSVNTEALNLNPQTPATVGSVMGGSTSKTATQAWREAAPKE